MHGRRRWLSRVGAGFFGLLSARALGQQTSVTNSAFRLSQTNRVQLEEQLQVGLRTNLPAQRLFIATVVSKVNQGLLSQVLVNLVYKWALKKYDRIPFPYFKFAMLNLAIRRGVDLTTTV